MGEIISTASIYRDYFIDFSSISQISYSLFLYSFNNDILQKIVLKLFVQGDKRAKTFYKFDLGSMRAKLRTK